jgi:PAS domain-containing protein
MSHDPLSDTLTQMRALAVRADAEDDLYLEVLVALPWALWVKTYPDDGKEGLYEYANPACLTLYRRGKNDIVGCSDYDLWLRNDADKARLVDADVLDTGRPNKVPQYLPYAGAVALSTFVYPLRQRRLVGLVYPS